MQMPSPPTSTNPCEKKRILEYTLDSVRNIHKDDGNVGTRESSKSLGHFRSDRGIIYSEPNRCGNREEEDRQYKLNVEKIGPGEAGPQSRAPFRPQAEKHVSMAEGIHWSLARKAKAALSGTYEELPNKSSPIQPKSQTWEGKDQYSDIVPDTG